jgi:hypothetical protein
MEELMGIAIALPILQIMAFNLSFLGDFYGIFSNQLQRNTSKS